MRRTADRVSDAERGLLDLMQGEFWQRPDDYDWTQAAGIIIRQTARRYIEMVLDDACNKPPEQWNGLTRAFYERVEAYRRDPASLTNPGFSRDEAERLLQQMTPDE